MIWLVDIDGTLSENNFEYYTFIKTNPKNFDAYFKGLAHIKPVQQVKELNNLLYDNGNTIIIFTARKENYRKVTEKWLNHHGIKYHHCLMREDNDYRPDHEVKLDMLNKVRKEFGQPFAAIEDRIKNIEMFAKEGIYSFNVSQGKDY